MEKAQVICADDREQLVYFIPQALNDSAFPKDLLPLALRRERAEWKQHERFKTQTLLLRSHRSFRCTSQDIITAVHNDCLTVSAGSTGTLRAAANRFQGWIGGMGGHAGYEEGKLFPFLEQRFKFRLSLLHNQHMEIDRVENKCQKGFRAAYEEHKKLPRGAESPKTLELLQDLVTFDTLLLHHLQLEENCVLPCLLSLSADEYEWYYNARSVTQALRFK